MFVDDDDVCMAEQGEGSSRLTFLKKLCFFFFWRKKMIESTVLDDVRLTYRKI